MSELGAPRLGKQLALASVSVPLLMGLMMGGPWGRLNFIVGAIFIALPFCGVAAGATAVGLVRRSRPSVGVKRVAIVGLMLNAIALSWFAANWLWPLFDPLQ